MLQKKITSTSGEVTVLGRQVSFNASENSVNLNLNLNVGVVYNRVTKEVTVQNYGPAELDETLTIAEVKEALKAAAIELDATF